jgi:acetyl-CoA carboxylase carboxyltransferase component
MPKQTSNIKKDKIFSARENYHKSLLKDLRDKAEIIMNGSGKKATEKLHLQNKLHCRERVDLLIDEGAHFMEIGLFTAYKMYEEYGGAPSAGTIFGIGKVCGRDCVIVANDATVKAGSWFPLTCKKILRAQEISMENLLPIIYLVDSAGVFLPMQDEIFPDKEHFGRIFRNNAVMSSAGIPQIAAIMGPCVAGGAYLPIMSDETIIVEGSGSIFLAGPHLVKAAIGEVTNTEALGGGEVSSSVSGITDENVPDDKTAIEKIRSLVGKFGKTGSAGFDRAVSKPPVFPKEEIYGVIPDDSSKPYNTYELIARIIDDGEFDEYKPDYGQTLITGYARIDGWAVGIVANQREIVKKKMPDGKTKSSSEMQFGGVIYSDSADKAARFIMNCNQRKIPLVFLQDVTGFMVGSASEHGGIIKDGAKMVNAVANSTVPKITIITGNSYGAGNYAMCGKAYDPRFIFAYPNAKIAVMGGAQASNVLLNIKIGQMKKLGREIHEDDKKEFLEEIHTRYDEQTNVMYAAARLWIDGIIDPACTRETISYCIELCDHNPYIPKFNVGVIQT